MIPFPCTTPDCDGIVSVDEHIVRTDEWFDPSDLICRDCADALIPDDVRAMRPASAADVTNCAEGIAIDDFISGYEWELDLDAYGTVPS